MGSRDGEISLQLALSCLKLGGMIQPLALVFYENLLLGNQVVNRLQDMSYRVQVVTDPATLVKSAEQSKPMLVLADLNCAKTDICGVLAQLRQNQATHHLPVIGFGGEKRTDLESAALAAGVTLVVSEAAILHHLAECLDQALQIE
jgi:PleD family two-component response regulator